MRKVLVITIIQAYKYPSGVQKPPTEVRRVIITFSIHPEVHSLFSIEFLLLYHL